MVTFADVGRAGFVSDVAAVLFLHILINIFTIKKYTNNHHHLKHTIVYLFVNKNLHSNLLLV